MLENEIRQKQVALNTLMNRDKLAAFDVDSVYQVKDYSAATIDSTSFIHSRSDIKAIDKDIQVTYLLQEFEKAKLKPEYGVSYNHMFGFGGLPMQFTLMAKVKLPVAKWASKANRANIQSCYYKK